ncbi:hypothetical protein PsorP6_013609 [Peronosclerospora sorghi]|uniref:Uncharacterized protein n=1 Tax=Peronosclerospora sorghi TaxID=230839 RepID=A0ACC0VFY0_9STRA|nr:hypothetical protein PsorP6_013609 [Peronosclerospora sorghi]
MEMELPATPTPTDARSMNLNFQSPTADKSHQSLRMQLAAHNFKKRAACHSPLASDGAASPLPVATCNFAALSRHFHLPLKVAAEKFGVRATAFKKRCRAIGIRHWPYRKVRSLKRSLHELEQCQQQAEDGSGPPLSDKQLRQFTGYQSQLKRLLSPETYGIDPNGQILHAHFFNSDMDGCNTPDDHDSDEDSCGSQSPRPGLQQVVHRSKSRKHFFTDSPSSTSLSSPHRDNLFFSHPMAMSDLSRSQYHQFNAGVLRTHPNFVFDTLYDPFGELSTSTMDSYGENDHPSCGYSLDAVSYDFFPLQSSQTMAKRRVNAMTQRTTVVSPLILEDLSPATTLGGLEGLEDDIFRHISPEYGCLV